MTQPPTIPISLPADARNYLKAFQQWVFEALQELSVPQPVVNERPDPPPRLLAADFVFPAGILIDNQGFLYMQSADGTYWKIGVDNTGARTVTSAGAIPPL